MGGQLYWRVRRAWFRYVFAAVFLASGFARRGGVVGDVLMALAAVLMLPTCVAGSSEPSTWRKTHFVLLLLNGLLAVGALTVQILCRANALPDPVRSWIVWLHLGGIERNSCEPWSFWEVACFLSSLLSVIWGLPALHPRPRRSSRSRGSAEDVSESFSGLGNLAIAILLVICATLDFNVFSAIYFAAFVWMLLRLSKGYQLVDMAGSARVQTFCCCLALLHVATAVGLAATTAPTAALWASALKLLGASSSTGSAQAVTAFVLAELLLWRPLPRPEVQGLPYTQPLQAPSGTDRGELQLSETPGFHAMRSMSDPVSRQSQSPRWIASWWSYIVPFLRRFAGGPILPIASLLIWSFQWPSLLALPLLAGALLLMVVPTKHRPLSWALLYMSTDALVLYAYNVYLSCLPEMLHTKVPSSYTWLERWGLQSFVPEGQSSLAYWRLRFVALQSLCLILLATSVRCVGRAEQVGDRNAPRDLQASALLRRAIWLARVGAVVLATFVSLSKENSFVGLAILLWLILLALSGYTASPHLAGWDGTRGHGWVWWILFFLSAATAILRLLWQVLATEPFLALGLSRNLLDMGGYLLLAGSSALQVRAFRASVESPPWMMSHTSLLAQCSSTFGIFLPMVLMFVVVMLPPASIFSFAVLLLFVAMAAVEQFGLHRFHSTVLMLTCLVAAIQLPFRFVVMLPSIKAFIQEHLPKADYKVLWEAFALDMDGEDARRKLMLMVALMLVSSFLCRGYKFWRGEGSLETVEWNEAWAEALREKLRGREGYIIQDQHGLRLDLSELNQVTPEQFPLKLTFPAEDQFKITEESCPRLVILLRAAASWSEALMILVSYFLLLSTDLLTRFQLLALTALLSSGRGWSYVGGLVSVSAMASLLIQYLFRFDFVQVSDQDTAAWLGILWTKNLVGTEVALAGLGIAQHAIQRVAARCEAPVKHEANKELVGHSALLGASLLLVTMVFSADAWSLLTVTVVAAFLASGDAGQGLTPRRAKAWLFLMSAVLVLSLLVSWALQSWLPPKYPAPPGPKEVADWPVCALFDDELQVNFYGEACIYCETQRQRCGKAWISWLRLSGSDRDHNLVQFLSLFLLSLLRRACNQRGESEVPSTGSGAAAACGSGGEGDDEGEAQKEKERAMWFHNCCAAAMWISLAGAALFQAQANLISVVYIVLLFHSIYTAGVAKTIRGRVRALQGVRTFNMLVMVIWAFYQCPSLPCGLLLDLAATGASGFLSPQQCAWLEKNPSSSSYGTGTMRAVSILLQSIGLQKVTSTVFFDWTNVLNIALFFSSSFLAVVCSRWDMQISQKIQEDAEELEQRSRFYVAHVKCWRKLELQQVATKHEILRQKLRDLIVHLNSLRAFWANMARPSDEEEEAKERKRAWQDFIQNLCLSSGAAPEQVIPELLSFAEAAGVAEQRSEVKDDRGDVLAVVDCLWTEHVPPDWANWVLLEGLDEKTAALLEDCILSVMRSKELQHLQRMSPEEVDGCEAELLRKCRAERLPPEESQDEPTSQNATSGAELLPQDEAHVVPAEGSSRPSLEELVKRTRPLVEAVIDDLLFCHVGIGGQLVDLTIEEHRKKDKSFFSLLGKALWSHAFELVALCAMLQFISYRSVLAFGSVFTVVISQMFFPHAPPKLWRFLQIYNIFTITLKMLYQIPVFCIDGSIDWRGCQEEALMDVPWTAAFGLLKVSSHTEVSLKVTSLFQVLNLDVLLGAVLFLHCHVLSLGGRLHQSPREICQQVFEEDQGIITSGSEPHEAPPSSPVEATARSASSASMASMTQDLSLWDWWRDGLSMARAQIFSTAELRKPAKDFYTIRFVLSLVCFVMLVVAWNSLAGTGRSFTAALTSNIFSGTQVFAIIAVMACMITDRALYTWYTQDRILARGEPSSLPQWIPERLRRFLLRLGGYESSPDLQETTPQRSKMAAALQMLIMLTQLVTLHGVQISAWAQSTSPTVEQVSMFHSFTLVCFYVLYVLYLFFSSAQLRYDVHLLRGGLGLTHSVKFVPWLLFKAYTAVPFVDELRVLTDWTVTSTSMNLFMWFKLEDAQQSLYKTKCDMNARKYVDPSAERPAREKVLQGGLFLLALFVLIVGPLMYFSTANMFLKSNLVYMGSLKANLEVTELSGGGVSQLPLYDTAQADIETLTSDDAKRFVASYPNVGASQDVNLQRVTFPSSADNLWLVSNSLRQKVATQLGSNGTKAQLVVIFQFQGEIPTTGRGIGHTPPVALNEDQVSILAKVLQNTSFEGEASIDVPCSIQTAILIDSSGQLTSMGPKSSLRLTLSASSPLPQWSMAAGCQPCSSLQATNDFCSIAFQVASEKVAPTPTGDSSSSNYSLMGIYLGVVYTIGRFLRLVFQDASKRIIYEEMNDTDLLQDLCSGIYIARITGDLKSEYAFYYELIRIYRSPELLLDISKPKSKVDMQFFRPTATLSAPEPDSELPDRTPSSLQRRPVSGRLTPSAD